MKGNCAFVGLVAVFLIFAAWVFNMPGSYVVESQAKTYLEEGMEVSVTSDDEEITDSELEAEELSNPETLLEEEAEVSITNSDEEVINSELKTVELTNADENKEELNLTDESTDVDVAENFNNNDCTAIKVTYVTFDNVVKTGFIKNVNLEEVDWCGLTFYTFFDYENLNVYSEETLKNIIGEVITGGWLWDVETVATKVEVKEQEQISEPVNILRDPINIERVKLDYDFKKDANLKIRDVFTSFAREEIIIDSKNKRNYRKNSSYRGRIRSSICTSGNSKIISNANVSRVNGMIVMSYDVVSIKDDCEVTDRFYNMAVSKEFISEKIYMPTVGVEHI
ncbi:hypothetical protein [Clostridium sp.]|uniref:hypothetical protein n=1 Tax=Clostridium sp. TaxID=1506 RepID=UPI001B463826|nr:hypothetical protein [Clostridium sp.]MBP3916746.1 hypothetical protein [Clostridium sp.]